MNIRRAAAGASIAALLPFAGAALAQTGAGRAGRRRTRICGAKSKNRSSACGPRAQARDPAGSRRPPRQQRAPRSRPAPRASRSAPPTTRTSSACAARCTPTARTYGGDSVPETADTFILRRVRPTFEGTFGGIYDFKFMPDFAGGRSVIVDAYVAARFNPGCGGHGRQVQAAGGPRAPAELGGHPLHRARTADQPRSESRPRRAALGRLRWRRVRLPGGLLQWRQRRPEQRQPRDAGRGSRTPPATTPRACSSSRSSTRSNFSLRGLGFGVGTTWVDVDGTAANTALSAYRSPGQQSVFAYRANTATGVTPNNATFANGERLRLAPQLYYYRGSFGVLGEYTQVEQDVSRTVGGTTRVRHADTTRPGRRSSRGSSAARKKLSAASRRAARSSRARLAGAPANWWRATTSSTSTTTASPAVPTRSRIR